MPNNSHNKLGVAIHHRNKMGMKAYQLYRHSDENSVQLVMRHTFTVLEYAYVRGIRTYVCISCMCYRDGLTCVQNSTTYASPHSTTVEHIVYICTHTHTPSLHARSSSVIHCFSSSSRHTCLVLLEASTYTRIYRISKTLDTTYNLMHL